MGKEKPGKVYFNSSQAHSELFAAFQPFFSCHKRKRDENKSRANVVIGEVKETALSIPRSPYGSILPRSLVSG